MKMLLALVSAMFLIALLTGCSENEFSGEHLTLPVHNQSTLPIQSDSDSIESGPTSSPENSEALSFEVTAGSDSILKSGSLIFTINAAHAINNLDDIPNLNGFDEDTLVMCVDGSEKIYHYPEYVEANGTFIDGAYLILIDVTVESRDAEGWVADDEPSGRFTDPYLFDSRALFNIVDVNDKSIITEGGFFGGDVGYRDYYKTYYSRKNEFPEDRMTFRILPGEKIEYSIGCVIGNNEDGSYKDLSSLCVRVWEPEKGDIFIHLGLSN